MYSNKFKMSVNPEGVYVYLMIYNKAMWNKK